ncbi:ABC transporter permease subunit [Vallitalea guaymasensis]|uniref:Maltose/maltodextrin transport system permease protein n=2 Tax=Vallitalea guaymasensis TaxID=1185412 RepID=A0A8J8SEU6_9FIRM|nr:ABC transporter permease subunit [Vallitalea guaymasensis]
MTKSGMLSLFIMGAGQLRNKQKGKALFFFSIQLVYVLIEILTSSIVSGGLPNQPKAWGYGFFRKGLWGFFTLGETTGGRFRDNSPVLMIEGLIVILLLGILIFFWIMNIRDANQTAIEYEKSGQIKSSKEYFKHVFETSFAYVVSGPSLVLLLLISIMPILFAFFTAFTNYDAYHNPPADLIDWVGLGNFVKVVQLPGWRTTFVGVAIWTLVWAIIATFTTFFGGLFLALVVNNHRVRFKKIWRTILILPWAIPGMVSLLVFKNFFNQTYGPLNRMLGMNIPWLNDPTLAKVTLIAVNFWLGVPYFMMLMTGILTSFDKTIYEAARVDGANKKQIFWRVTFPILLSQVMPLLIMSFAGNFNNFGAVFFLTNGSPRNIAYEYAGHTDILITWIYKMTKDFKMYNMASIMSILIFLLIGGISTWNFMRTDAFKED